MLNSNDIPETLQMITSEHLDVRTVTMGIYLLDCADPDGDKAWETVYHKITEKAQKICQDHRGHLGHLRNPGCQQAHFSHTDRDASGECAECRSGAVR